VLGVLLGVNISTAEPGHAPPQQQQQKKPEPEPEPDTEMTGALLSEAVPCHVLAEIHADALAWRRCGKG